MCSICRKKKLQGGNMKFSAIIMLFVMTLLLVGCGHKEFVKETIDHALAKERAFKLIKDWCEVNNEEQLGREIKVTNSDEANGSLKAEFKYTYNTVAEKVTIFFYMKVKVKEDTVVIEMSQPSRKSKRGIPDEIQTEIEDTISRVPGNIDAALN